MEIGGATIAADQAGCNAACDAISAAGYKARECGPGTRSPADAKPVGGAYPRPGPQHDTQYPYATAGGGADNASKAWPGRPATTDSGRTSPGHNDSGAKEQKRKQDERRPSGGFDRTTMRPGVDGEGLPLKPVAPRKDDESEASRTEPGEAGPRGPARDEGMRMGDDTKPGA